MERRLAAVVAIDILGYSRLMGADETGTLSAVNRYRLEVLEPLARQHKGRIVKLMGDGVLMEFASAVEAVTFAVQVQRAMHLRNAGVSEDRQISYRIGINIGDVIIEGDDIFGEGVNIASRLEALSEPGGICIAGNVYNQVKGKLDLSYGSLGRRMVKNIAEPVETYRILLDGGAYSKTVQTGAVGRRRPYRYFAAASAIVLLTGGFLVWQPWVLKPGPSTVQKARLVVPDKPSIAVLPFTNMGGNPEHEYFADGMTDDLITDLSKLSGLFVIARNSVFTYKGKAVKVRQVAEDLGVRYVLQGSVRRVGNEIRINAQLIDAGTGGHLWAERYDSTLDNVFRLQDEVARKIVNVLAVQLTSREQQRIVGGRTESPAAYDEFLKGWTQYIRYTPDGFRAAIDHFKTALQIDQDYVRAYAALAAVYWEIHKRVWQYKFGLTDHEARFEAEIHLRNAMKGPTALGHQIAAAMLSQQGQHTEALAEGAKAIGINPNDPDSYVALAGALNLSGNPEQARQLVQQAMRLNPYYPPSYLFELGLAEFCLGLYSDAAATLEKATAVNPEDRWSFRLLLAVYGYLGRKQDGERIFQHIAGNRLGTDPISITAIAFWHPFKEARDRERLAAGLRLSNVPE